MPENPWKYKNCLVNICAHLSLGILIQQEMYYDDDSTQPGSGTLERMTHQIKEVVDEVYEMLQAKSNGTSKKDKNLGREIER